MFGLAVLFFIALYLVFLVWVARGSYRYALLNGATKRQAQGWGFVGGFIVWLAVFWDWLPTEVAYRYYCSKYAGVSVFKTIDQWKRDNPNAIDPFGPPQTKAQAREFYSRIPLSRRFVYEKTAANEFLSIRRSVQRLIDAENGEVMAQQITYQSGYPGLALGGENAWKAWLKNGPCYTKEQETFINLERAVTNERK
jgi:hypothetical protein